MYNIFIAEDDEQIASILCNHLQKYGYHVSMAQEFDRIKQEVIEKQADLVLLDINLPYFDGFYWCRQIRAVSNVPIIFISARTDELNQVMAIEHGGDDYMTKPFHLEVVLAKMKSVLRRTYGEYSSDLHQETQMMELGGLYIYPDRFEAECGNKRISLSQKEFQLLSIFVKEHGRIVSRDELLEALWDEIEFVDDNTLTVNVNRLRKKLSELGIDDAIATVRGQGYRFSMDRKDE
ncbi:MULTISPECIES: response regulator transcription factor [Bacillus]|uniref:Response regulator transcription factor n=1 Tax=Bacillus glycinifermentans TaxID=1664069 RepID=A0AAJ3Z182_9BACI|nr:MULTISPECIES: response regulator transcription factor [Bacillus]KKB72736.1 transcriptional regulator [Bacillus sp. TH008]MDU0073418.1 response regulator transcription factor [Bacillus sp. IG6]MED8021272.1 response regulator transcription factor [Bacillus glycinifermentans]QAT67174.1 response regulator transcription factor [Bacillus glycinifermentans]WKB76812.1 response regulator transcription factor [Bacillus glycinifermentans]